MSAPMESPAASSIVEHSAVGASTPGVTHTRFTGRAIPGGHLLLLWHCLSIRHNRFL